MNKKEATMEMRRRQGIFERHVQDCEDCESAPDGSVHAAHLCMSGTIMFRNYFNAIQTVRGAQ